MKKKKKKRYLQACDMSGSLYGKKTFSTRVSGRTGGKKRGRDTLGSYRDFYSRQVSAMEKIFGRSS
jgi:hypothetical protein